MDYNKEIFDKETLDKMYENLKTKISEEQIALLERYFNAANNFYQIISLKRILRIFNDQNDEKITEENFLEFAEFANHEEHFYSIVGKEELYDDEPAVKPIHRELIHELYLMENELYDFMEEEKDGLPYYVPPKDELIKYEDQLYFDETPQFKALSGFFERIYNEDDESVEDIMGAVLYVITSDEYYPSDAIDMIEKACRKKLKNKYYDEFVNLYCDLNNTTRNPWLNGFTPEERYKKCGDKEASRYLELYK